MDDLEKLAEMFKVFSDPTRLKLVKLLSAHDGALCVNALARHLEVTQSAVSQHLRILRQVGLVESDRRGTFVHYALNRDTLESFKASLLETLGEEFVMIK
jgi:ArsR family transcriptional regulator